MFSVLVIFIFVISPPIYVLERTLYQMQNRHILPNLIGSFFFFSANISTYHINIIFFLTNCLPYGHPIFRSCWSNSELKTGHSKTTFILWIIIKKREASFNLWPWWVAWGIWRTDRTLTYPFYYTALTPFFVKLLLPSSSTKGSHPFIKRNRILWTYLLTNLAKCNSVTTVDATESNSSNKQTIQKKFQEKHDNACTM